MIFYGFKPKEKFWKFESELNMNLWVVWVAHLIDLRLSIFVEKSVMSSIKDFSLHIYHEIDKLFLVLQIKSFKFLHMNARQL